ncbi:T9SS type A sorting domain-containing protein [bacterium]|nr:T9SS type A sorting domain-containing protein [bacterium]
MKNHFTLCSLFTLTTFGLAVAGQGNLLDKAVKKQFVMPENAVVDNGNQINQVKTGPFQVNYNSPGVVVGNGWYDYQANGGVGKRIVKDENNRYHLTFISANLYTTNPSTNTTRGSFYSYSLNGTNWGLSDGAGGITPIWTRIENARGGFPSLDYIRNNSQNGLDGAAVMVSHFNDPTLNGAVHSVGSIDLGAGQGLWEHPTVPVVPNLPSGDDQPIWPVCTVGDSDKVHFVASIAPSDQATSPLAPYYGALANPFASAFDPLIPMQSIIPLGSIIADAGAKAFVSDAANHIVLVFQHSSGKAFQDTTFSSDALYKFESTDGGATWTFDNLTDDTPLPYVNSNNITDYQFRATEHFDATFDAQGGLHYVYTEHRSSSSGSYYPSTFRLIYKNASTGFTKAIFEDFDHVGTDSVSGSIFEDGSSWIAQGAASAPVSLGTGAFQDVVGTPMLGFDTNGAIHVIFEGFKTGDIDWTNAPSADIQNAMGFGDVWHTMSTNGGQSWGFGGQSFSITQIENITHSTGVDERYPMCPPLRMAAGNVEVAFQTDDIGGSYSYNGTAPLSAVPALGTDYHFYSHPNGTGTVYTITLVTGAEENTNNPVANNFVLSQNYPNPFNPTTKIDFSVANKTNVEVSVFNINGQLVKTLFKGNVSGAKSLEWNGTDFGGNLVASGTYLYTIKSSEFTQTKKMTFVK